MVTKLYYGENQEVTLDTAFSLSFLSKMVERGLLSKNFVKLIASGDYKVEDASDFLNIPYCCYLNATLDPMTKAEFDERFIVNSAFIVQLIAWIVFGDMTDSKMKNVFRFTPDPKTKVKEHQTSGRQ